MPNIYQLSAGANEPIPVELNGSYVLGQALYGQKFSTRVDWKSVLLIAEKIFGSENWLGSNLPQSLMGTRDVVKNLFDDPNSLYFATKDEITCPIVYVIPGQESGDIDVMDDFEEVEKEDDEIPGCLSCK